MSWHLAIFCQAHKTVNRCNSATTALNLLLSRLVDALRHYLSAKLCAAFITDVSRQEWGPKVVWVVLEKLDK
jgi:hypothetical protein